MAVVVASLPQQIESLSFNRVNLAVAASNLTGNAWNGYLSLMALTEEGLSRTHDLELPTCLSKVAWLGDRVLLAGDDGALRVLNSSLRVLEEKPAFDYSVTDLQVTDTKIVACDRAL